MIVVLDLEGTLADASHRAHHVKQNPKDWEAYLAPDLVLKDKLITSAARVLHCFQELRYTFVIITERRENLRDVTMRWIHENLSIDLPEQNLLMRPQGNMRTTEEYKREQLLTFRQNLENKDADFLIIDDDATVGMALRSMGTVLKAPECWDSLFPLPVPLADD